MICKVCGFPRASSNWEYGQNTDAPSYSSTNSRAVAGIFDNLLFAGFMDSASKIYLPSHVHHSPRSDARRTEALAPNLTPPPPFAGAPSHSFRNCIWFSHLCKRAKCATCFPMDFRRLLTSVLVGLPWESNASLESPMETWAGTTQACRERPMVRIWL